MSDRKIVVKSVVERSVVCRQFDLSALTDCSELLDVAHAQVEDSLTASVYGFTATGQHGECIRIVLDNEEDFVTDFTQGELEGCTNVTFFAQFDAPDADRNEEFVHHIHSDEHHLTDLSVVDGVTKDELDHCHRWGVYTVQQAKDALPFQVPDGLTQRLNHECKIVRKPTVVEPTVVASAIGFDLGFQMGRETRFMHSHAPMNHLAEKDVWALSFAIDPETVYLTDHHQNAIKQFTVNDSRGAIGTHVDLHPVGGRDALVLKLRHSDTCVLSGDAPHEETFDLARLDLAMLTSTQQSLCNEGHVYKHSVEALEGGWALNNASVVLNDAMVSQANFTFLQHDDRSMLVYCSLFTNDPDTLSVAAEPSPEPQEILQNITLAVRWNKTLYMRDDLVKTWRVDEQTRFGDLYAMAFNNLNPELPNDFPSFDGTDTPDTLDVKVEWTNSDGKTFTFIDSGRQYRELWFKDEDDESAWQPRVVGSFGRQSNGSKRQESFDPQSGDDKLVVEFDLGDSTDIGASASDMRITGKGRYRLLPNYEGGHDHTVNVAFRFGFGKLGGISSFNNGHRHVVIDGVVQPAAGHTHETVRM
jgi:hypothetical protein